MGRDKKEPMASSVSATKVYGTAAIIGLLSVLLYVGTAGHGFVLDDVSAITENFVVQKGTDGLATIWETHYRHGYWGEGGSLYRPVSLTLFAWQWEHWPDDPAPGHITNIVVYGALCVLLFFLFLQWFTVHRYWLAIFCVIPFLVHPLHSEVVANIKSADELLAALFGVIALLAVSKNDDRWFSIWSILAALSFFFAISSKESAITLIPVAALAAFFFKGKSWQSSAKYMVHFVLPTLAYLMLRVHVLGGLTGPRNTPIIDNILHKAKGLDWFATVIELSGLYLFKMLFPHPLSHDYSLKQIPIVGFGDWQFWLAFIAVGILFYFGVKMVLKRHFLGFAFLVFLCTFSLYSNVFITIGTHFGERLMFLPTIGWALAVGWLFWKWGLGNQEFFKPKKAIIPMLVFAGVMTAYGFKTVDRNADWSSEFDLYTADVESAPNSCRTHYRLGMAMMKERALVAKDKKSRNAWLRKAVGELKKAVEIYPSYADAQGELGLAYQRLGYKDLAVERYELALKYNPSHKTTLNNMGTVLFEQAKFEEAAEYFLKAIDKDKNYKDAIGNLASCYGTIGEYEEAIRWFKRAVEIDPRNGSYYYFIGITYQRLNKPKEAEDWLFQAYALDPSLRPKQ
ncbi:MAG: hypothetical protein Salg2KO_04420 [Salibacteraceae bacterium]